MAYLVIRNVKGGRYYYIVKSFKKDGKVRQKTLEYLGRDPGPRRLKRACTYWKVGAKPQGRKEKVEGTGFRASAKKSRRRGRKSPE